MHPSESLWQAGAGPQGVSSATFYNRFRGYLAKAGLPPSGVHVLRHTAAKLRRDVGESVESVSQFLDHSSLAVTTTYLRSRRAASRASVSSVSARLGTGVFRRGVPQAWSALALTFYAPSVHTPAPIPLEVVLPRLRHRHQPSPPMNSDRHTVRQRRRAVPPVFEWSSSSAIRLGTSLARATVMHSSVMLAPAMTCPPKPGGSVRKHTPEQVLREAV